MENPLFGSLLSSVQRDAILEHVVEGPTLGANRRKVLFSEYELSTEDDGDPLILSSYIFTVKRVLHALCLRYDGSYCILFSPHRLMIPTTQVKYTV